jgi:hypothetical protein
MRFIGRPAINCPDESSIATDQAHDFHILRDLAERTEQIGQDYFVSWRPNPVDMVCAGDHPARIRKIIRAGLAITQGCGMHITLKDVKTVEGEPERLKRRVALVRDLIE